MKSRPLDKGMEKISVAFGRRLFMSVVGHPRKVLMHLKVVKPKKNGTGNRVGKGFLNLNKELEV